MAARHGFEALREIADFSEWRWLRLAHCRLGMLAITCSLDEGKRSSKGLLDYMLSVEYGVSGVAANRMKALIMSK